MICMIKLLLLNLLLVNIQTDNSSCSINPLCFVGCSNNNCIYSTMNFFYNPLLSQQFNYGPQCCSGCNQDYYLWPDNLTCSTSCNNSQLISTFGDTLTRKCVRVCQEGFYADQNTYLCERNCTNGTFSDQASFTCVNVCQGQYPYTLLASFTCSQSCDQYVFRREDGNQICGSCPETYIAQNSTKLCILPQQDRSNQSLPTLTIIIIGVTSISFLTIIILFYKYYLKKRLVRKDWQHSFTNDILFG